MGMLLMITKNQQAMKSIKQWLTKTFYAMVIAGAWQPTLAWDHPGHMTTAAIAFAEIERLRPDLIDKIGLLLLTHPDPAPFWVASGEAKSKERIRRMFIEAARWPDDNKFTNNDRLTWHSARWAVVTKDAPPEAILAAKKRVEPLGQGMEAISLMFSMISNPESSPAERAWALSWLMHILGDIHEPMHVSDLYSKQFPTGNLAGSMGYVMDPVTNSPITLHILWDSNVLREPTLSAVDKNAQDFVKKYPRSFFPELTKHSATGPNAFVEWAKESNKVAADWAFNVDMAIDTDPNKTPEHLVKKMVNFILYGVAPIKDAPQLPAGYFDKLATTSEQRLTLAGYRLADLLIAAADQIDAQRFISR